MRAICRGRTISGSGPVCALLRLRALAAASEGRMDDALADTELLLRAAQAGPYDAMSAQMLGMAFCKLGVAAQRGMLKQCDHPDMLRRMLEIQERLAPSLVYFSDRATPLTVIERLGSLREIKRRGVAVDVRNVTTQELLGKTMEVQAPVSATESPPRHRG